MPGPDFGGDLRADAANGTPHGRQGLWLSFLGAYGLEALLGHAIAGYGHAESVPPPRTPDWLGVDLQHGELEIGDLAGLLRVSERVGIPLLTRMTSHDPGAISRALDAGVDGVIVPTVESAEQATALVRAVRLPPVGRRSQGAARAQLGLTTAAEPLLLLMVETRDGLEAAADIAGTDGVDGIFMGPYDLSVSLGFGPTDAETLAAVSGAVGEARKLGKVAGMFAGLPELVALAPTLDLIAVDSDVSVVRRGLAAILQDADYQG